MKIEEFEQEREEFEKEQKSRALVSLKGTQSVFVSNFVKDWIDTVIMVKGEVPEAWFDIKGKNDIVDDSKQKEQIKVLKDKGYTDAEVSKKLNISASVVSYWTRKMRESGEIKKVGSGRRKRIKEEKSNDVKRKSNS